MLFSSAIAHPESRTSPADPGFGLYVHWPFCQSKCPYCDFNSHVREEIEEARWRNALLRELDHFAGHTGSRGLTSIFFGGGTPSLMAPETVAAVIDRAALRFGLAARRRQAKTPAPGAAGKHAFRH